MSTITTKTGIQDWFESSTESTRRLAIFYYESLGPLRNESDKDLIPLLGFIPGCHTSTKIDDTTRQDTFFISGKPQCLDYVQSESEEIRSIGIRQIKTWLDIFIEYDIHWHPRLVELADIYEQHTKDSTYKEYLYSYMQEEVKYDTDR